MGFATDYDDGLFLRQPELAAGYDAAEQGEAGHRNRPTIRDFFRNRAILKTSFRNMFSVWPEAVGKDAGRLEGVLFRGGGITASGGA